MTPKSVVAALAILSVVCTLPLLVVKYPPMQDLPAHVLVSTIVARPALFPDVYQVELAFAPYVAFYAALASLQSIFAPLTAAKILVATIMVLLPLAVIDFARSLGQPIRPSS